MQVLLLEYDVNTSPFSPAVHACVPPLPWSVGAEDYAAPYRRDLRDVVVCSVDPPGCKDIDDALHARELPNGNLEIGVHIADVTHFVHAGSAMDEEASRRSTTVYLVDKRVDMLPKPLTEDICRYAQQSPAEKLGRAVFFSVRVFAADLIREPGLICETLRCAVCGRMWSVSRSPRCGR